MMEEKIKEFRTSNSFNTNQKSSRQPRPKEKERDKFIELQGVLPTPKPMSEASA